MGAWFFNIILGHNLRIFWSSAVHLFSLGLLLHLLVYSALGECFVDHCAMEFTRSLKSDNVLMGQNLPYCILLRAYETCLKETSRGCRGNLKYHTLRTVVSTQQKSYDCSTLLSQRIPQGSPGGRGQRCLFPYRHSKRAAGQRLCTLFGDPHLRTFDGQYETCGTAGAWPLVENSYIGIQVTNDPVFKNSKTHPTAITKVTVIVKALRGCTNQKVYEGSSESLPGWFTDGTRYSGESREEPVVDISVRSPGFHVVIHVKYVAIKLVIRRHGNYLSLAVRIPEEVIQKSPADTAQLCLSGCPYRQKIAFKEYLAAPEHFSRKWRWPSPKLKKNEAAGSCKEAGVTDFYFDACVFDLLVSGNMAFRDAARDSLGDARRLYSPHRKFYETNRTDLSIYDHLAKDAVVKSLAPTIPFSLTLPLLLLLLSLFCANPL